MHNDRLKNQLYYYVKINNNRKNLIKIINPNGKNLSVHFSFRSSS